MTTKKATTKKTGGRRPTIKDRARAIVEDVRGYDVDTRMAVQASLDRNDAADLAETVRMAEAGEIILDLAGVAEKYEDAARLTIRLTDHDVLPGFMLSAIMDTLVDAGHH